MKKQIPFIISLGLLAILFLPISKVFALRNPNPTAPNEFVKYLSGDFTDSDGDSMTDVAEKKYGFDPFDAKSFPKELKGTKDTSIQISESGIGATLERNKVGITIRWKESEKKDYSLTLKNKDSEIYRGGHENESATVAFAKFNLQGNEILTGSFSESDEKGKHVKTFSEFTIDLSKIPPLPKVGDKQNRITYTFSDDFPKDSEKQYRAFLQRVFPLFYVLLGPPAESFNVLFKYTGEEESFFMIVDDGRTFLTDGDFIPRLITHELIHAWKGSYGITSDKNWEYDDTLTAFEEATAEGMAFEIVHEYVRSYPNDPATLKLLDSKAYQYWSAYTTYYDSIKYNRWTRATDFWTHNGGQRPRYSIVATTFQMLIQERPTFMPDFMEQYYKKIRENSTWRPNRNDIIDLWESLVPQLNGYKLRVYLDTLPVFTGKKLDPGIYILNTIKPYGLFGEQHFSISYANKEGQLWWGLSEDERVTIPSWIKTTKGEDSYHYIDMQNSKFVVSVVDAAGKKYPSYRFKTALDRSADGSPSGLGWYDAKKLAMEKFPMGLYKETITFPDYLKYDAGAQESFYFFGLKNFTQDRENEYVIMIGIDGVSKGKASIQLKGKQFEAPIKNGVALFRSSEWPFDMEGKFPITITKPDLGSKKYYRTLIESATIHDYYQQQFIIVDKNFDGIEDQFQ